MPPDPGRAREGDRANLGMASKRIADFGAVPIYNVEQAFGHACFLTEARELIGHARCRFRRKQDEGIARRERLGRLLDPLDPRAVYRRNSCTDSLRTAQTHSKTGVSGYMGK